MILDMDQDKLFKELQRHVDKDPKVIGEIMRICMNGWKEFVALTEQKRNTEHLRSVIDALYMCHGLKENRKLFTNHEIPLLLDAIKFAYPKGRASIGCNADSLVLETFVKSCRASGFHPQDQFIDNVRGFRAHLLLLYSQYPLDNAP